MAISACGRQALAPMVSHSATAPRALGPAPIAVDELIHFEGQTGPGSRLHDRHPRGGTMISSCMRTASSRRARRRSGRPTSTGCEDLLLAPRDSRSPHIDLRGRKRPRVEATGSNAPHRSSPSCSPPGSARQVACVSDRQVAGRDRRARSDRELSRRVRRRLSRCPEFSAARRGSSITWRPVRRAFDALYPGVAARNPLPGPTDRPESDRAPRSWPPSNPIPPVPG